MSHSYLLQPFLLSLCCWLTPAILATWEAEIWWINFPYQPGQRVLETPIFKKKKTQQNGLEVWLKWKSICFATTKH
jgi:hypothetical protein